MKSLLRNVFILLLATQALLAQAALYSWVDKDGKKHFGDKVPAEYAKQVKTVDIKAANSMEAPPVIDKPEPAKRVLKSATPAAENSDTSSATNDNEQDDPASCEAQKQAYQESLACFNKCRDSGANNGEGRAYNNVAACGHCTNVKKPKCD